MTELDPRDLHTSSEDPAHAPEETVSIGGKKHKKHTVFYITAVVIALFLLAVAVLDPLTVFVKKLLSILSPIIIGAIIAYLCDPILEFFEFRVFRRMSKGGLRRGLSLLLTVIVALGIVTLIGVLIIPQLINSLTELFGNYETYLNRLLGWLQSIINGVTVNLPIDVDISDVNKLVAFLSDMFGSAENAFTEIMNKIQQFATDGNLFEKLLGMLLGLFNAFKNAFLGVFIAFYILASKEKRSAQIAKFRKAMFSEKTNKRITEIVTLTDHTFGGFIYGKILDSIVIGVLTFILMSIFEISPYNVLIATFVGITNIIPVFGPFIGAIPSFFIVLISNPSKAFLFLLLIFIIQQLDGNIIGPKILGDNTGVSSLCVIIAICICGSLWGIAGMLIGVPVFAVIIELVKRLLEDRLKAKGEPTDTLEYYPAEAVINAEQDLYYEHSSLRYRYEHSNLKPRMDRLKNAFLTRFDRQNPPEKSATPTDAEKTEAAPHTDDHTGGDNPDSKQDE